MPFCTISWVFGIILVTEWFFILYYCRMKFKTRYALATVTTFLTMAVYIHIAFNCIYATKTRQLSNLHQLDERDYDPRVRSVNYDLNHRDLLEETRRPQVAGFVENTDDANKELYQIYQEYFQEKRNEEVKNAMKEPPQLLVKPKTLIDNQNLPLIPEPKIPLPVSKKSPFPTTKRPKNKQLKVPVKSDEKVKSDDRNSTKEREKKVQLDRKIAENLKNGIYNDKDEARVTMNTYQNIANQITHENNQQQKDIRGLSHVKLQQAWDEVKNRVPLTTAEVLEKFGNFLPWWEQIEITYYSKIYYLGLKAEKSIFINNLTQNFGFDNDKKDEEPMYTVNVGDHIYYRYEIKKELGSGTYGVVVYAYDHGIRKNVAIKFLRNRKDWKDKNVLREFKMYYRISQKAPRKEYFPKVYKHFMFRNHKCIVMELLGESIHRSNRNYEPMQNVSLTRRYTYDILNALLDLEKMGIIHADLKPANIIHMAGKTNKSHGQLVKLVDFGLSCMRESTEFQCAESHVQTRFYKCPEVLLSLPYDNRCDIYSLGIIVGEMYIGKPPVRGESNTDQLAATMEVLGVYPPHMVAASPWKETYQEAMCYVKQNGFHRVPYRKPLETIFEGMPKDMFDFLEKTLTLDPEKRLNASQALLHPFILNN